MKTRITPALVAVVLLSIINYQLSTIFAQGTAFSYQGRLNSGGSPATGNFDLRFKVYDAVTNGNLVAGPLTNAATGITNGLFSATLNFGTGVFSGPARWLQIGVRTNGSGAFTNLAPSQPITPVPYAIMANSASNLLGTLPAAQISGAVGSANLSGTYGNAVTLNNAGNSFSGAFSGDGAGLAGVNAATVGGLAAGNFWQLGGNTGKMDTVNYLGTADAQPLYLDVGGSPMLILGTNGSLSMANSAVYGSNSVVLGYGNYSAGAYVAVLGGQSNQIVAMNGPLSNTNSMIGGGYGNSVSTESSVIAGGVQNATGIQGSELDQGSGHTIGGGAMNTINYENNYSTIGGGYSNFVDGSSATIAGGFGNYIMWVGPSGGNTIGGGTGNVIGSMGNSTIGGGANNCIKPQFEGCSVIGGGELNTNSGDYATIPGGYLNLAAGNCSFAAGNQAQAANAGAFVWGDGSAITTSTANDQFMVRSSGGAVIYSSTDTVHGVSLAAGSGTWASLSDRNAKDNLVPAAPQQVLSQVVALPISKWSYTTEKGVRHIGPMAQDFYAAFGVGADDRHITEVDEGGVALAAIQGLDQKLEAEAKSKDAQIDALKQSVAELRELVQTLAEKK